MFHKWLTSEEAYDKNHYRRREERIFRNKVIANKKQTCERKCEEVEAWRLIRNLWWEYINTQTSRPSILMYLNPTPKDWTWIFQSVTQTIPNFPEINIEDELTAKLIKTMKNNMSMDRKQFLPNSWKTQHQSLICCQSSLIDI